ncbi:MAG: ATP-dependent zinc metalloprotease FtsH, partial [Frankia sp.]
GSESGEVFLGRDMGHQRDYSEEVASEIDAEVRSLIEAAHDEAWEVLVTYRDVLDDLVLKLMDSETLSKEQVLEIFATVDKRPSRGAYVGSGKRVSAEDRPPVMTPAELGLITQEDVAPLLQKSTTTNGTNGTNGSRGNGLGTAPSTTPGTSPESGGEGGPASSPAPLGNPWAPPIWPDDEDRRR